MIVPETNAFTINRLGSSFFPLSIEVFRAGDVITAHLCAQRVLDICDIIEEHTAANLVLFRVDQLSLFDESGDHPLSLQSIAAQANIRFAAIDTETIVLAKATLKSLLVNFDHHNLMALEIGDTWSESEVVGQVITFLEHDWRIDEPLLAKLPASRNLLISHDDCFLTLQTRDPAFVRQVFARTLQIYAGTVLGEYNQTQPDIPEIPDELLLSFWQENFGLAVLRGTTEIDPRGLRIAVARKPFSFREPGEYPPQFWIRYELPDRHWALER